MNYALDKQLSSTEQPRVSNLPFLNRTNLRSFQSRYGHRLPMKRQKLHLKCFASFTDVYHGPNVSRLKPLSASACR